MSTKGFDKHDVSPCRAQFILQASLILHSLSTLSKNVGEVGVANISQHKTTSTSTVRLLQLTSDRVTVFRFQNDIFILIQGILDYVTTLGKAPNGHKIQ